MNLQQAKTLFFAQYLYLESGNLILMLTDYLRSIGILLPFTYINEENKPTTLTPAEIVVLGWVKLKED